MANLFCMIWLSLFATTLATPLVSPFTLKQQEVLSRVEKSGDFKNIGRVGSKLFVMHKNASANWMDGLRLCKDAGLEFAKVENCDEFNFIYHHAKGIKLWISGIMRGAMDNQTKAFAWHKDGKALPLDGVNLTINSKRWYCVYLGGDHHSYVDFCFSGRHQTLCQLKHS